MMLYSEKAEIKNIIADSQKSSSWGSEIWKPEMTILLGYKDDYDKVPFLKEFPDYWPVV